MLKLEMLTSNKKELVNRLAELTGEKPKYTGVPACAYKTSMFTIEKNGTLVAEDGADQSVIQTLVEEGLVKSDTAAEEPLPETDGFVISFPTEHHTVRSLINLINLVYTRAGLLNKALGTHFRVDESVVEDIKELPDTAKVTDLIYAIGEDGMEGLEITEEKVSFGPLPDANAERGKAFMDLTSMMCNQAIDQKRIRAKEVNDESEKYALRIWLLRLGMNGPEYKETRKVLMANLSGSAAFRNDDEKAKWTARQTAKRHAMKESKAVNA